MIRSLMALAAASFLLGACASGSDVTDELAGETAEDEALDSKADALTSPDGVYTYFEVWKDTRKCASPACGGYFLYRLNRTSTVCHNGASRWACYVPELDWSQIELADDLKATLEDAAMRGASSWGALALVRGRFGSKTFPGAGNMGRFIVTEAWVAQTDTVSEGVFVKARDNGVRCIQAPCPSVTEKALNTSRSANIAGIDWSWAGLDDEQVAGMWSDLAGQPGGVIVAGDRYTFKENNVSAKGRTATAAYRQLVNPQGCFVGGCSGQICSDQEGLISTCEWREEYACYQSATCERQADGQCGWTQTPELQACLYE